MSVCVENQRDLARLAPALRALQMRDGRYPRLRFYADWAAPDSAGLASLDLNDASLDALEAKLGGRSCDAVRVAGRGSFLIANDTAALEALAAASGAPAADAPEGGKIRAFASYRRMYEKVVIVTGSAQGFGEGIARELANEGAYVVIADMNYPLAQTVAASINQSHGRDSALALEVNVADEASVEAMVQETVLHYGGLDALINNAGVLRAGGLEEMDVKSFEFVTKINYEAYFICTKYATRPMKIQNRYNKTGMADVIQVNSKSGLEGSNRNFAYAGGKFGGIGLTQSFAKELVTDRIKCNAVCPGNFYEGPLWSDPEKGLFVQYLKAGKVAGAKTVQDVYEHYISLVPMRKGCSPLDVARAIFYLIEQQNETGQALPVTGGQTMLN